MPREAALRDLFWVQLKTTPWGYLERKHVQGEMFIRIEYFRKAPNLVVQRGQ